MSFPSLCDLLLVCYDVTRGVYNGPYGVPGVEIDGYTASESGARVLSFLCVTNQTQEGWFM